MLWMICWTCETKIKSHKFIYEWILFFVLKKVKFVLVIKKIDFSLLKKSYMLLWLKIKSFDLKKYQICFVIIKKMVFWFVKNQICFLYVQKNMEKIFWREFHSWHKVMLYEQDKQPQTQSCIIFSLFQNLHMFKKIRFVSKKNTNQFF